MVQQPDEAPDDASLHRYAVDIPQAMIGRIDALASDTGHLMDCDVTRAALFRAALLSWLARVEKDSPRTLLAEIHKAAPMVGTLLQRTKTTWSNELNTRLDKLIARLGEKLSHSAAGVRSALVLAALRSWFPTAEDEPRKAFVTIRAGLVKRGRKPKR
jgi:hypothetical protein